jgi:hypothetical protein
MIAPEPARVEAELAPTQPERMQVPAERSSKPRRGRPPKAKPVAPTMVEEPIARAAIQVAPAELALPVAPRMPIAPLKRTAKQSTDLPIGERWKRRLGR